MNQHERPNSIEIQRKLILGIDLDLLPCLMQQRLEPVLKRAIELYQYEIQSAHAPNWRITIKAEEQKTPFRLTQEFVDFQMDHDQIWCGLIPIESYGYQDGRFEYSVSISTLEGRDYSLNNSSSIGNAIYLFNVLNWDFSSFSSCEDLGIYLSYGIYRGFRDLSDQAQPIIS